jgi:hypothetical protein
MTFVFCDVTPCKLVGITDVLMKHASSVFSIGQYADIGKEYGQPIRRGPVEFKLWFV